MANPSPPLLSSILLLILLLIVSASNAATSITIFQELEETLQSLRNHGYRLFTNAITTSDLQYQLLTTTSSAADDPTFFTLFAPKDELLFALDIASDAAAYVSTLSYHVVPNLRHTFADLQNLSSPFLETLLPHYSLLIGKIQDDDVSYENTTVGVMVDGVRVSDPDLFVGSRFAVHGIDGVLLTGLNLNRDFISNDNPLEVFPPVESPAPVLDSYIPEEGSHAPISDQYGNILAEEEILTPITEFYRSTAPISFYENFPADETITPPPSDFDWDNVEADPIEYSPWYDHIPVSATLKVSQDKVQRRRSPGRKKRGKRHGGGAPSPEAKGATSSPSLICKLPAILVVWAVLQYST